MRDLPAPPPTMHLTICSHAPRENPGACAASWLLADHARYLATNAAKSELTSTGAVSLNNSGGWPPHLASSRVILGRCGPGPLPLAAPVRRVRSTSSQHACVRDSEREGGTAHPAT